MVTSAVESIDERVLKIFNKGHTKRDFIDVTKIFNKIRLVLNPTFVTFTPWTTLENYRDLLLLLSELNLIENVSPIQLGIRLLIPPGSKLLELPEVQKIRVSESNMLGSRFHLLTNIFQNNLTLHNSKLSIVNRNNRAMSARMFTPATRLNIPGFFRLGIFGIKLSIL